MSSRVWTPLHGHSDESNGLHYFEIATKYNDYVDYHVTHGIKSIAITNHGSVANWISHKLEAEKAGLKYIHGLEAYVTMSLEDKSRYHTILLAKNYEGVKAINQLSSDSFKPDHFYYKPRITFEELKKVVEEGNIYVTTACLASGLAQSFINNDKETSSEWIKLAANNRDNVFLEVQPHLDGEQKAYNQYLLGLSKRYNLHLIASNDIHALDQDYDKIRKIIKTGKHSKYEDEDKFELWCKTYDEMFEGFKTQGILSDEKIEEALDFTNEIANSIEEFELDRSPKYPHLYKNPEKVFQDRITKGLYERGIMSLPKEKRKVYLDRVKYEYSVYKHNGAIDYMLTDEAMVDAAKEHGIPVSYGRGSVSGSLIAYLIGSTEMDSVKLGLNFERFMNKERVSLADIDHDWEAKNKEWIQKWLLTNSKWSAASILTLNTYGIKGAVKAIADGLPRYAGQPAYIQTIRNQINDDGTIPDKLYKEHRELFDLAKKVVGVIDSFGRHAAGVVVDTNPIEDAMGTMRVSGWDYATTQITMHDIEYCKWVKMDVLGLDNIGLISRTCELAGLPFLTPNSTDIINFEDKNVWNSMRNNNIGVFQMEGERAGKLLKDILSPETINRIHSNEATKDVKYIDLLSLVNAAQRPSGASHVDAVTHGEFKDNGHPALNKFLAPTLGRLVYQEQLIQFLVQFCGYTAGRADVLRRAIGHKIQSVMDEELPKIQESFIQTMINKYHDSPEHAQTIAKDFIQVFMDAADYGFSINHSMAYSYIGYISTWLRYYYPVEWCTAAFQIWNGKQEKLNRVTNFAKEHDIHIKPIRFGKSKGLYYMDKDNNDIYEGVGSVKNLNVKNGDQLYLISDKKYNFFTDLLLVMCQSGDLHISYSDYKTPIELYSHAYNLGDGKDLEFIKSVDAEIKDKSTDSYYRQSKPVDINSKALINLILLNYFEKFGGVKKLIKIYNLFHETYKPNNKTFLNKYKKYKECLALEKSLPDEKVNILTQLDNELELLGRCVSKKSDASMTYVYVTDLDIKRSKVKVNLYSLNKGATMTMNISKRLFNNNVFKQNALIDLEQVSSRPKNVLVDGIWEKSETEHEYWLTAYRVIRP
ncbi:PHP domain-containing protein [Limosilactobacillus reuteri]|uniref:DNA polymerase III subunit alpha n=1 Tax=Limosilactobacillus reuteri TaxID=1598 RepID=A0ABD6Y6U7_LIMRT|nr:PHP domain-containing protein [Limosilactobacillus reuteri]PWT37242.1 DNA polymerase III subunit alpha [Limosilactobacillus reuteri]